MPRLLRIPQYRRHSSGQARVTFNGQDVLLGPFNSSESQEAYRRLIAQWLEGRSPVQTATENNLLVKELILAYWKHAVQYYGFEQAKRGDEACLRTALRVIKNLYGNTYARKFGPLALKTCRSHMVELGWCRTYTNAQVDRIRRMFRWAAAEQLLPSSIYQDLRALAGLR